MQFRLRPIAVAPAAARDTYSNSADTSDVESLDSVDRYQLTFPQLFFASVAGDTDSHIADSANVEPLDSFD